MEKVLVMRLWWSILVQMKILFQVARKECSVNVWEAEKGPRTRAPKTLEKCLGLPLMTNS